MKNQKGSGVVWIIIILVIIIVAGAAYWYLTQTSAQSTISTATVPTQTTVVGSEQNPDQVSTGQQTQQSGEQVVSETPSPSTGTATITTNSNVYLGFDNPFVIAGTATGYSSLHISIQAPGPGCTPDTCIVSTSTVSVVNGQWSLQMPEGNCCTMQNAHSVYVFPPNDQDFNPSANNPPIAQQSFTIHESFSPITLTSSELTGDVLATDVNSTGLKTLDILIYGLVPTGNNNVSIGQLVYSASSTPIQFSDCAPSPVPGGNCVLNWSVPLTASLQSGTEYEIVLYAPGHYNVPPLSQSSLGTQ